MLTNISVFGIALCLLLYLYLTSSSLLKVNVSEKIQSSDEMYKPGFEHLSLEKRFYNDFFKHIHIKCLFFYSVVKIQFILKAYNLYVFD